jgi:cellulose synthase/poly-beta-1,6-N-acetylglucosamine synthase-like glycosyltransferase
VKVFLVAIIDNTKDTSDPTDWTLVATLIALIPAHNEEESIGATIEALFAQNRIPDRIVVIPNGCRDRTADIARSYQEGRRPLTVMELPSLQHKKSEALNRAWAAYARDADIVICLDADTILPPNAIGDWEREMVGNEELGGSSSKFTMLGGNFWTRLQRSEFAKWTDTALRRGYTTVLAGTGCAISGRALREVVESTGREGPWSYDSQVEDFELTYRIRELGYKCQVSPTVRAYTDSMKSLKSLWGQRMKWQVGTVEDLLDLGVNRLTRIDWWQQFVGLFMAFIRVLWFSLITLQMALGLFEFHWLWWLVVPTLFAIGEGIMAWRIPHRDRIDTVMAFAIIPSEIFATIRSAWFVWAWIEVLKSKVTGSRKDRWELQYAAEARAA